MKFGVKAAEAGVERAQAQLKQDDDTLKRLQPLLPKGFAPATDLDVIRDRVAGIILGIFVVSLIFRHLWPERAVKRLSAAEP